MKNLVIDHPNFDFLGVFSRIDEYCSKSKISEKTTMQIELVFEELVYQILWPKLARAYVTFVVEYTETDGTEILVTHEGGPIDMGQAENEFALSISSGVAADMQVQTSADKTTIRIRL